MYKEIYLILSKYLCDKTQEVLDLSNYYVRDVETISEGFKFTLVDKEYGLSVIFHFEFDLKNHQSITNILVSWWAEVLEFADEYSFMLKKG